MNSTPETNVEGCEAPGGVPRVEGAHGPALRRMLEAAPQFRPDASPEQLIAEFANGPNRMAAFLALYERGPRVLPAVRKGLQDANWNIRHWSAILADNSADGEILRTLTSLLHDPKTEVRVWAVHSLSCESCRDGPNPVDVVPLLLERIQHDPNIRVRRQAVAMLPYHRTPDPRVLPVFQKIVLEEDDRKLRLHAEQGLKRYGIAGLRA